MRPGTGTAPTPGLGGITDGAGVVTCCWKKAGAFGAACAGPAPAPMFVLDGGTDGGAGGRAGCCAGPAAREGTGCDGAVRGAMACVGVGCGGTAPEEAGAAAAGRIGEVRRGASAFEAELRGLQAPLNVPVGRVFSRFCDADLGDARCGKNIETAVFRGEGAVTHVLTTASFRASGLAAFTADWFTRGRVVWNSGGESEVSAHRLEAAGALIELLDAPGAVLALGAGFAIYAGCDKRHETCRVKFANVLNFRGFPHMPGNDAVQARPDANQPLDGSSRFS